MAALFILPLVILVDGLVERHLLPAILAGFLELTLLGHTVVSVRDRDRATTDEVYRRWWASQHRHELGGACEDPDASAPGVSHRA